MDVRKNGSSNSSNPIYNKKKSKKILLVNGEYQVQEKNAYKI